MQAFQIIFFCVYAALLAAYCCLKAVNSNRQLLNGCVKMSMSAMFVAAGVYGCVKGFGVLPLLALFGLTFAAVGDFFLVYKNDVKMFGIGVAAFGVAAALLAVYSIGTYGFAWWSVALLAAFCTANVLCQVFKVYSFGGGKVILNVYMVLVGLLGCLGMTLFGAGGAAVVFGAGCALYFVSDIALGLYLFRFRLRTVNILNSLLYFSGMMLVAVSLCIR